MDHLHPFIDAGVVADSLMHPQCYGEVPFHCQQELHIQGLFAFPTGLKFRGFKFGAWRQCSGSSSTYPSVMIGVIENISHNMAKICWSTVTHVPHLCSVSGTSFSSFGRSCKRKSQLWLSVSWCGKTCGPTKQSPTVPDHTLMLNCCYNSQIKCFWTYVGMEIFSRFRMWNWCPKFVCTFRFHPVYLSYFFPFSPDLSLKKCNNQAS
jgi:hypothetical protein